MDFSNGLGIGDFADMSDRVLRDLRSRVGMEAWLVTRRDGPDQVILSCVDDTFGIRAGTTYAWSDSYCAQVLEEGAPMVAADIALVPAFAGARARNGLAARSCLSVPILTADGESLGSLCALGLRERPDLDDFLPTVQVQATVLGALLAHELHLAQEARRAERTESQANTDPLTGTGNRQAWEVALRAEERRAARYATSAAVVIINVDAVKDLNAGSGLHAGDALLVSAAALLTRRLRGLDVLTRQGDDFAVILPQTGAEDAVKVADDVRRIMHEARIAVAVGVGQRRSDTGMVGAWKDADVAMCADKLQAAQRRIAYRDLGPEPAGGPAAWPPATTQPAPLSSIDALLHLAKDQLGMDVAFLNTFEGQDQHFRNVVSSIDLPIGAGFRAPRQGSYCQLIVDGELDAVTTDASAHPKVRDLPVTRALGIGSYVGIPVHRRDGTLYGTLCVFSRQVDDNLRERDAGVLRAIAGVVMDLVEVDEQGQVRRHQVLQRLNSLYAQSGPQIVYQPIQSLGSRETVGVEALSRFPSGSANPDEWFTSAAAAGVGTTLELAALSNAVRALPLLPGFLALNASPAALVSPGFARLMERLPLPRIVLEITEHEPIAHYASLLEALEPLRAEGLRVAIDDAGAGFASMRHILMLVPDFIKLDISLVRGIDTDRSRQALASALSAFAAKTGALVIAEGIETVEELECLQTLDIEYGQGYHLSRPAPIGDGE